MRLAIKLAAAGSRTGEAASRDFAGLAFTGLSGFAAIDARSQIRQAYGGYRASYDIARYQRDEVVPLRKAVAQQSLLRYNASLISIFELLADAREQFLSNDAYIHSVRDFWIAKSELDAALLGNSVP